MIVPTQIFENILTQVINEFLIPKYDSLGMRASGRWAESLQAQENSILGERYSEQLVYGRKPGNRPPIEPLIQWVGNKFGYYGAQAKSFAFAIAKKIEKEGTEYHKQGGTDLLEVLETNEVKDFINQKLGIYLTAQVQLQLQRQLQTLSI